MGEVARPAVPYALSALRDGTRDERFAAAWMLGKVATPEPDVVRGLVQAVAHTSYAADVLVAMDRLEPLVQLARTGSSGVRRSVMDALLEQPNTTLARNQEFLRELARSESGWARLGAIEGLVRLGEYSVHATDTLRGTFGSDNAYRVRQALRTAEGAGAPARLLIPAILDAVGRFSSHMMDDDFGRALVALGVHDPAAVALGLFHSNAQTRYAAGRACRRIGAPAIPGVLDALESHQDQVRNAAKWTLLDKQFVEMATPTERGRMRAVLDAGSPRDR